MKFSIVAIIFVASIALHAQEGVYTDPGSGIEYRVEEYVATTGLSTKLVFAPDGRLFYTEKDTGAIRVISPDGILQEEPVIQFPVLNRDELGMTGIALDASFEETGYIWVYIILRAEGHEEAYVTQIVRFTEKAGVGSDPQVFWETDPAVSRIHTSANLFMDDEGYFWFSTGERFISKLAQDFENPYGKLHRFIVDGDQLKPAPDNPIEGSSIYAYGLRNPFDFVEDPYKGNLFLIDNGSYCDDELSLILPGFNYGWGDYPEDECHGTELIPNIEKYVPPLFVWEQSIGVAGVTVYNHQEIPEWEGDILITPSRGNRLDRLELDDTRTQVVAHHEMPLEIGSLVDITVGPDGYIYFVGFGGYPILENEGGKENIGAIYRIVPVNN